MLKRKENVWLTIMKRFYGSSGMLDEYRIKELNRIGNNAFIILFCHLIITNLLLAIIKDTALAVAIVRVLNMIVFFGVSLYTFISTKRKGLLDMEVEATKQTLVSKQLKVTAILQGLFFGIAMAAATPIILVQQTLNWTSYLGYFSTTNGLIATILVGLCSGAAFGLIIYVIMRSRVKTYQDS